VRTFPRLTAGADAALPSVRLGRRVRRLQEGVRENAVLAVPLEAQVVAIEQSLVPLLEASVRRAGSGAPDEPHGPGPEAP
jgi:hypothetical protein